MTVMAIEPIILHEMLGDMTLACDNSDSDWCPKGEAKWVVLIKCPACMKSRTELWCTCLDFVLATEDGFECAQCAHLVFPARHFIASVEPLNRSAA